LGSSRVPVRQWIAARDDLGIDFRIPGRPKSHA